MNGRPLLLWLLVAALAPVVISLGAEPRRIDVTSRLGSGKAGFQLVPANTSGVAFTNFLAQHRHLTNNILLDGSGVACGDVDGDGWVDLYFARLDGPNALYRNLGGWKFQEIAERAGVACTNLDSTGVALADLDGDADLDLMVNSMGGGTHIFFNDGKGVFKPSPQNPLNGRNGGTSLAAADIDGNGTLDVYIANYRTVTLRDQPNTRFSVRMINGQPVVTSINGRPLTDPEYTNRFTFLIGMKNGTATFTPEENGEADGLYLNDGKGRLTQVPFTSGAFLDEGGVPLREPPFDWGLSVMMRDINGDGAPDIYVCNDFKSPDRIWINNGKGRFRAISAEAIRHTTLFSMGVDMADINRDGFADIFVLDMLSRDHRSRMQRKGDAGEMADGPVHGVRAQSGRNTLLIARGDGTFAEVAQFAGLQASEWSWTPIFLDVDLDGYEDVLIANGFERDSMSMDIAARIKAEKTSRKMTPVEQLSLRAWFPRLTTPNLAFRNLGNGRFADASAAWGFALEAVSQGMALADLDNDGDMDVVVNNFRDPAFLLQNTSSAPRLGVRLKGLPPNSHGIGARITVHGGPVTQSQEIVVGGRYQSSDDAMRMFAATMGKPMVVEVQWRSGRRSVLSNAVANSIYEIEEASANSSAVPPEVPVPLMFEDVSARLNHRHAARDSDDFARQPLLPREYAAFGPAAAWADVDGDGWDDLLIAGQLTGGMAGFRNERNGQFTAASHLTVPGTAAQAPLIAFHDAAARFTQVTAISGSDDPQPAASGVQRHVAKAIEPLISGLSWRVGPFALADIDGNGELDLFVGGHAFPGRYPEPASSLLLRQSGGVFSPDTQNSLVLTNVGLVSGAMFTDINGDSRPDLVLACDWGSLRVFTNSSGKLVEATAALGFDKFKGWWTAVASIDANADGQMDIVAGNWGENTKFEPYRARPLRLYYGDLDGNGNVECIESYFDPVSGQYVPARQWDVFTRGMPWLQARFPTWESLSRASVNDVLGDAAAACRVLEVNWPSTTVFLNRGNRFEAMRLPDEAQYTPAFGIAVADFNGDSHEDIVLAQNFFGVPADTSRHDAGRGLLLLGNGGGTFSPVPGNISGIAAYGEQRAAAVSDFDGDGRTDLLITQHDDPTKLYRNATAQPGLRIRLAGAGGNKNGIGAAIQIGDGTRWGAAREVQAGAGYASQNSAVQVLARSGTHLRIKWPHGNTTVSALPHGAGEITVSPDGTLRVTR